MARRAAFPAARAYADPTSRNGLIQNPPEGSAVMHLASSLKALATTVPPEKIFYFQISDGSRKVAPDELLKAAKDQGIAPLYAWSNAWRPLPYMDTVCPRQDGKSWGGYLPVLDVCEAVLKTGWRGPWSYEVRMVSAQIRVSMRPTSGSDSCSYISQVFYEEDMSKEDQDVPTRWTKAAQESHKTMLQKLQERGC